VDEIGWGEGIDGRLLDSVLDGLGALCTYAQELEEIPHPTVGDLLNLLDYAEEEAGREPGPVRSDTALGAIDDLRAQLTAAPAVLAAA
jgi:hypothetical protein